jgi:hypothetical protein
MKKLILLALALLFAGGISTRAQTCTASGTTLTAATANEPDVKACLNAATSTTTQINIPAGSANWTTPISWTVPSGNNNLAIHGATVCTPSGTPGTAGYTVSCTDNTSITDGISSSSQAQFWATGGINGTTLFRITGITFTTGRLQYNGFIGTNGNSPNFRFDHNHVIFTTDQGGLNQLVVSGCLNGVADHNLMVMPNVAGSDNGIDTYNGQTCYSDSLGLGDQVWAHATSLGASNFFFIESNEFINGASNDCLYGGRFVMRYNTVLNTPPAPPIQTHATSVLRQRGCRAWEIYGNYEINTSATEAFEVLRLESGTGVVWGNTVPQGPEGTEIFLSFHSERSSNYTYTEYPTPNGWGYCGTNFNGTGSNWDENLSTADGHECLDNVGMGIGDLLTGGFTNDESGTNNVTNSATGCIYSAACAWPRQALEPVHEWMDTVTVAGGGSYYAVTNPSTTALTNNREFFVWCNASSSSGCTSFNGTVGTGSGTLVPTNSSAYTGAPTCTNNVGYFDTTNQTLYVCNSGTWASSYTPYTYPHPLVTGGPAAASPPACSPTSGVVPQTVTCTNPNFGTTVMGYAASPTTPVTNGSGTGMTTGTQYSGPITVSSAETLNVVAGTSTLTDSSVSSYTYSGSPVAPTVITTAATSITSTGATSGGTVTATGGASVTSEGIACGTATNPTTVCVSSGTATPFTSVLTSLTPNTTYYYRAFAVNSAGTGYGSTATFTTLTTCANPVSIGPFTACNFSYTDLNTGTSASVGMGPYAGNGIEIIIQYCANTSCSSAPTQTVTSISDNINSPETCFTQAPHSPYAYANTNVPDYETIYAYYCPSIPAGVTGFTVLTNATVNYLQPDVVEWLAGTIASTGYFENVDAEANAGATAGTTATVSTSATTVHANDLITSMIANCGASISATPGTGYTGLIVNPSPTPGHIFQAMAVSTVGTKTATTTWSTGSAPTSCALGAGGSNDTWFGVTVPLVGHGVLISPSSQSYGLFNVGASSSPVTFTLTNNTSTTATSISPSDTDSTEFPITNSGAGSCAAAGGSLAASASCTFTVTFSPTSAGIKTPTLSVSYSGGDGASPQTAPLSGTGVSTTAPAAAMFGILKLDPKPGQTPIPLLITASARLSVLDQLMQPVLFLQAAARKVPARRQAQGLPQSTRLDCFQCRRKYSYRRVPAARWQSHPPASRANHRR